MMLPQNLVALALGCVASAVVASTTASGRQDSSDEQPLPGGSCPAQPNGSPTAAEMLQYERDSWPEYVASGFVGSGTTPFAVRALRCRTYRDFGDTYFCRYRLDYVENRPNRAPRLRTRAIGRRGLGNTVARGCDGRLHGMIVIIE